MKTAWPWRSKRHPRKTRQPRKGWQRFLPVTGVAQYGLGCGMLCLIALTVSGASAATLVLPDGIIELGATQVSPEATHVLKLFESGQTAKADTALARLLQATPYDVTGNLIRGHLLLRSDPQTAINIAASIVASNGPSKDALDLMGMAFARYRSLAAHRARTFATH
jgi:hypothetical protein